MSKSKITLYRTDLTAERNACIDDLEEYLSTKSVQTYFSDNFQYQKLSLNMIVTIAVSQETVGNQRLGNYCKIEQDYRPFYFFITDVSWTSQNAVKLTLSMDTINTFAKDLEFSHQTSIIREHVDRLKLLPGQDKKISNKTLKRVIDKQPENITLKKELVKTSTVNEDKLSWYLIYKTRDDLTPSNYNNPVDCFLLANESLLIHKGANAPAKTFTSNDLQLSTYYYFAIEENPGMELTFSGGGTTSTLKLTETNRVFRIKRTGTGGAFIRIEKLTYKDDRGHWVYEKTDSSASGTKIVIKNTLRVRKSTTEYKDLYEILRIKDIIPLETGNVPELKTKSFYDIDRTDSKLIKIISLPYAPGNFFTDTETGEIRFNQNWQYDEITSFLKLQANLSTEFVNQIATQDLTDKLVINEINNPTASKKENNESKLLNSNFYTYKYVYDSFSKEIAFENYRLNPDYTKDDKVLVPIYFKPTNTINSKFAFRFVTDSGLTKTSYAKSTDYEDYMLVDRNNEETIFSNDYINYIRNGYNYDKKAKNIALVQGILGIATGAAQTGTTLGIARGTSTYKAGQEWDEEHPYAPEYIKSLGLDVNRKKFVKNSLGASPFLSAAAISAGFGAVNGITNTVINQIEAQDNINRKLRELSQQSTNVQGADDVDLLHFYNGNKLEIKEYDLEELGKKAVFNLFYLTGYNHSVQEVPNTTSRYWFNFVQCNPIFKHEHTSVYSEYLDDIRARFANGVTYFHHHPELGDGWDLDQEYENWETSVVDTSYLPTEKVTLGCTDFNTEVITTFPNPGIKITWKNDRPITEDDYLRIILTSSGKFTATTVTTNVEEAFIKFYTSGTLTITRINKWNNKFNSDSIKINI